MYVHFLMYEKCYITDLALIMKKNKQVKKPSSSYMFKCKGRGTQICLNECFREHNYIFWLHIRNKILHCQYNRMFFN